MAHRRVQVYSGPITTAQHLIPGLFCWVSFCIWPSLPQVRVRSVHLEFEVIINAVKPISRHCTDVRLCVGVGMGPMPWTVNSEIYPLWARSTGNACSAGVNWICNVLVSLTFLHVAQYLTYYGTTQYTQDTKQNNYVL